MNKEIRNTNYLLGVNKDNEKVWLKQASFDCGWYYGFGYVETHDSHSHFDSMFLKENIYHSFKDYFQEIVLNDDEVWALLELMQEFYTLRKYSDLLHTSGAHITKGSDILEEQKENNMREYDRINKVLLPAIFKQVYTILGEV